MPKSQSLGGLETNYKHCYEAQDIFMLSKIQTYISGPLPIDFLIENNNIFIWSLSLDYCFVALTDYL